MGVCVLKKVMLAESCWRPGKSTCRCRRRTTSCAPQRGGIAAGRLQTLPLHAGKDQVNEAAKGGKGGGLYFPLTAVQVRSPHDSYMYDCMSTVTFHEPTPCVARPPFAPCAPGRHAASISECALGGAQRWDSKAMVIENGVYLGWPAALTFRGPFIMSGVRARDAVPAAP